ncbi:hypothetical protein SPRG_06611 [Saprolegnia parasitica CBS 223.65]|uniref:ZNF598/HEL2 PAH domain-containing protein n=1 Tax=Saprolegnia parasitica (strain CBS 223.65) TaxID=695850 RepID=A0A067CNH7_SAPPC|nr:hypothetical protein SPRG_06611 [Saprolegnia parasitica CBS 223.65]KDO28372.1 hypothetical protein SPRG_06611 [Saprolegnia parasitica CBS 223.65]|eukprot:XP_012200820.1 hypothetical protein SPRG_06611 [Saprolegnia parasitica CBS 223.65]
MQGQVQHRAAARDDRGRVERLQDHGGVPAPRHAPAQRRDLWQSHGRRDLCATAQDQGVFGQATKPSFLAKRQDALGKYLRQVLSIADIADFHSADGSQVLADFALIHAHVVFANSTHKANYLQQNDVAGSETSKADDSYVVEPHVDSHGDSVLDDFPPPTTTTTTTTTTSTTISAGRVSASSDDIADDDLTQAQQEELQALIVQRIQEHTDVDVLKQFQKQARRFGRAAADAADAEGHVFFAFMVRVFGRDFCAWLVPSLAQLLPDPIKKRALCNALQAHDETPSMVVVAPPRPRPASDAVLATPPPFPTRPQRSRPASMSGKDVVAKVRDLVDGDEERVSEFKAMTKELRTSRLSASEYSDYVVSAFGARKSQEVLLDVANAMTNPRVHEELTTAIEVVEQQSALSSLRATMRQRRNSRRMSLERNSSFISRRSNLSSVEVEEDDGHESAAEDVPSSHRVLNRLKHQGAVNLMNFK